MKIVTIRAIWIACCERVHTMNLGDHCCQRELFPDASNESMPALRTMKIPTLTIPI